MGDLNCMGDLMTDAEIDTILAEILSSALNRTVTPGENVARKEEFLWDSLKHIEIILAVESAFDVYFSEEEIVGVKSVTDLKTWIGAQHAA